MFYKKACLKEQDPCEISGPDDANMKMIPNLFKLQIKTSKNVYALQKKSSKQDK